MARSFLSTSATFWGSAAAQAAKVLISVGAEASSRNLIILFPLYSRRIHHNLNDRILPSNSATTGFPVNTCQIRTMAKVSILQYSRSYREAPLW
jgi:hypothetical protein